MPDSKNDSKLDTLDPAAQVAEDLHAQLRRMKPEELLEMAVQLLTTYVVEGVPPLSRAQNETGLAQDSVGDESFAGLLKRVKAERRNDPVLDRFHVDGENISVRLEGFGLVPLTEYRRSAPPPAAGGAVPRAAVPTPRDSIYNRSLYPEAAAPQGDLSRPVAGATPPAAAARPAQGAAPAARGGQPGAAPAPGAPAAGARPAAQQGQQNQQGGTSDRFKLIELD
jgi:hypothetical protein